VEYMIKAKSQFKRRSTANNVEIVIPVPADADSPKFKTTIGSVKYAPEQNAITWTVKSFPVSYHYSYVDHKKFSCRRVVDKTVYTSLETFGSVSRQLHNILIEFDLYTKLVSPVAMFSVHAILCGHINYIDSLRTRITFKIGLLALL
jgi:hypothetical protein